MGCARVPGEGWGEHRTGLAVLPEEANAEIPKEGDQVRDLKEIREVEPMKVKCYRWKTKARRTHRGPTFPKGDTSHVTSEERRCQGLSQGAEGSEVCFIE